MGTQDQVVGAAERLLGDGFHRDIIEGLEMQERGWEARRAQVLSFWWEGLRPGRIAYELARQARAGGCTDDDLRRLGISEHNVRAILRRHLAGEVPA